VQFVFVTIVHQEPTVLQHKADESTVSALQVIADTSTAHEEVATSADATSAAVELSTQQAPVITELGTQQHTTQEAVVPIDNSTNNIHQQQQQQQQQLSRAARRQQSNSSSGKPIHEMFASWAKSPWITAVGQVLVNFNIIALALSKTTTCIRHL
jgi:hypothetical protein